MGRVLIANSMLYILLRTKQRVSVQAKNKLLADFCNDYGAYHKTYKEGETVPSLLDWFVNWF